MAIDKPSVLALATAYGFPAAGIAVFQVPDANPLHANGEWLASLAQVSPSPSGGLLLIGPVAYGATPDLAAQALYAALKLAATNQSTTAQSAAAAAAAQATAVNAVVTK